MAAPTKLEFSVKMTCSNCVSAVKAALEGQEGVTLTGIDLNTQQVLVETTQPSNKVKELIEKSGRRAALMGMGRTNTSHLGAAVSMIAGSGVQGVVRLLQTDSKTCLVEGTVDGLQSGPHRLAVHEFGDISDGCQSCGAVLDMVKKASLFTEQQGDLGEVEANDAGRAEFRILTTKVKVGDIIGRSMIVHSPSSFFSDKTKLACGIIARSSGLFENAKRICACDGVSVWDERDVPLAGPNRRQKNKTSAQL